MIEGVGESEYQGAAGRGRATIGTVAFVLWLSLTAANSPALAQADAAAPNVSATEQLQAEIEFHKADAKYQRTRDRLSAENRGCARVEGIEAPVFAKQVDARLREIDLQEKLYAKYVEAKQREYDSPRDDDGQRLHFSAPVRCGVRDPCPCGVGGDRRSLVCESATHGRARAGPERLRKVIDPAAPGNPPQMHRRPNRLRPLCPLRRPEPRRSMLRSKKNNRDVFGGRDHRSADFAGVPLHLHQGNLHDPDRRPVSAQTGEPFS